MRVEIRIVAALALVVFTTGTANEVEAQECDFTPSFESLNQGKIPNPVVDTSDCNDVRQRSLGKAWAGAIENNPTQSASSLQQLVDFYKKFDRKTNLGHFAAALYEDLNSKRYKLPDRGEGYQQLDGLVAQLREGKFGRQGEQGQREEQGEQGENDRAERNSCPNVDPLIEGLREGRIEGSTDDTSRCGKEQQKRLGEAWAEAIEKNPDHSPASLQRFAAHYQGSGNLDNLRIFLRALYERLQEKKYVLPSRTAGYGHLDALLVELTEGRLKKKEDDPPPDPDGLPLLQGLILVLLGAAIALLIVLFLPRKGPAQAVERSGWFGQRPAPRGTTPLPQNLEVKTGSGTQADNSVNPGNKEQSRELEIIRENLKADLKRFDRIEEEIDGLKRERVDPSALGQQIHKLDLRLKAVEDHPVRPGNPPGDSRPDFSDMERRLREQVTSQLTPELDRRIGTLGNRINALDTALARLKGQPSPTPPAAPQGEPLEISVLNAALDSYDAKRWERIQGMPKDQIWQQLRKDVLDALPRAVAWDEELRVACETLIAPLKELDLLATKVSLIPDVASRGPSESTAGPKRLLLIRECEHLMFMFQYFGSLLADKLDFSVEKWAAERFLGFGDLLLRKYQEAEAAGQAAELEEARRIVVDVLRLADLSPVEISLGRTQFDSSLHMGRSTARRADLPDGAIVSVVRNGFQRSDGSLWRQPEVIVNRL